jgi:hypothetical protein
LRLVTPARVAVLSRLIVILGLFSPAFLFGQQPQALFFREDWKEIPAATPVTQEHVTNPKLLLGLYGPSKDRIKKSHHDAPRNDPYYIWSGECNGNWALTLRDKTALVDLSGPSEIRWRSFQSGFRRLHIALKLADGTWLVSEESDGASATWHEREFNVADLHWRRLAIAIVVEGKSVDHPDLTRVDEIGFTDLMTGGGSDASSRVDWIEVLGKPVARP